ncbi:MAG TPA: bifunctional diaminohydroxyphosphoribosylaminopyrimidine deaminase/5-amino-6-(5-phosphoribosylamino)uracil reductase RibD [Oxalicibacterium sp.]|nr:bifunctional diaminohydroxyphosphoribosylaminopyrimidine deaminase/5-amino-6-(5-phosphoribosylamino)uracil reductase RibD [Oxalicibacterium sp.]
MRRALRLAERGLYTTMPNPRVGCVIVRDGEIVGEGAHLRAGEHHAEVDALRQAGDLARGADVYVTLEPCSHYGRTPPCANALIQAGVKRVFAAMQDPNPDVAGSGLKLLEAAGIEVHAGLLQPEAEALNPGFISRMSHGTPYVRSKIAASLDGRTALTNGVSQWITGEAARADVQHWRARSCAILTGSATVLHDDPQMTVRSLDIGRQPLRVVADSQLAISPHARILADGNALVVYASDPHGKAEALRAAGIELLHLPEAAGVANAGRVCLSSLLRALAVRGINEVLVEAGEALNGALLQHGLIDECLFYYAPVLMGSSAKGMFAMPALTQMAQRQSLELVDIQRVGADLRVQARLRK